MLKKERREKIVDYLDKNRFAKIDELSKLLKVSEITIRRDINELDAENKLLKVYGGASSLEEDRFSQDIDLSFRKESYSSEKLKVAKVASQFLKDDLTIYLDAGSTVHNIIPYLKDYKVTVYTHGIHHIEALSQLDVKTFVIGGLLKTNTLATVSGMSLDILSNLSFDLAFVGFNGLDLDYGYSTPDELEASVKKMVVKQSSKVYFVGDSSKFYLRSGVKFASIDDGSLISDKKIRDMDNKIIQIL